MFLTGIITGLIAALLQSSSYVASRIFLGKHGAGSTLLLLISAHVHMGIACLLILPFVLPEKMPPFKVYFEPLFFCMFFYLIAQIAFFRALKKSDASRVSPLLGLKILFLSLICFLSGMESYSLAQWGAVLLSILAAVALNFSGGTLSRKSIFWILLACICYGLSDLAIVGVVRCFETGSIFQRSMLGVSLCYLFAGICSVCVLPFTKVPEVGRFQAFKSALPFAFFWFTAVIFLFICFGSIGAVYGNIIQSTRGVISIVIGFMIAKAGYEHIEKHVGGNVLLARVAAAILMTLAIALFHMGRH